MALKEIQDHLREDIAKVDEPQLKAMFETSAEVLGGLLKAFSDYEKKNEAAWRKASSEGRDASHAAAEVDTATRLPGAPDVPETIRKTKIAIAESLLSLPFSPIARGGTFHGSPESREGDP
jgi:hypothetical protein